MTRCCRLASASCFQATRSPPQRTPGVAGLPNGELIRRAAAAGHDVTVSLDRGILQQQNLPRHAITFVLIPDNDVDLIRPYADRLRQMTP